MDPIIQGLQFLDLTDINDAELNLLQNVLNPSNPGVKYPELPWDEPNTAAGDDDVSGSDQPCSVPPSTLNPEVPPYPSSSAHMPVPYMVPSVYVNNVTANVSVHPYMSYHPVPYPPQDIQSSRGGRRTNKAGQKPRDYRNVEPNLDGQNPSSPIQQQYPGGQYILPYNYYSTPGHMQSAQQATGAPIFLPNHVTMYQQPQMQYSYQPMFSPVDPTIYANEPDKMRGYDYSRQNNKEQYHNEPNDGYTQEVVYNSASDVKEPSIVNFQEKIASTNYNNNRSETIVTHYASKSVENNVSYEKEPAESQILNNCDKSLPQQGEVPNNCVNESKKLVIVSPETKVKIPVTYGGDVIVSELKTDAQIFRPANRNPVNNVVYDVKKEIVSDSEDVSTPAIVKSVDPVQIHDPPVQMPPITVPDAGVVSAASDDVKPVQDTAPAVVKVEAASPPPAVAVEPPAPAPSGKSWASLFKKNSGPAESEADVPSKLVARVEPFKSQENTQDCAQADAEARRVQKQLDDPQLYRLGEFLSKYELDHRAISLQPRGLTNRSNWCYVNSTLQALLACPPFYNLMKALPSPRRGQKSQTPILDSIIDFVNEFVPLASVTRANRKERSNRKEDGSIDVQSGAPFEPSYIYKMLNNIRSDTFKVEGRQEDAEEFLSCLLNALNDEMLEVVKLVQDGSSEVVTNGDDSNSTDPDDADSEWRVMGPKNKGAVTRRSDFGRTPVSDIFRGHLRSRVQRAGDQSTDNVQPFFTLQLDIEKAQSVKEALELLVGRDQLEGVTCTKTNQEVEAWQQVTLEDLPLVLVLHLKWFDYKVDGCTKIVKSVEFPIELKVDPKLMSSNKKYVAKAKQYKLFAVVYHDGKEASKGHYVTDAFHVGYGGWVRYDDSAVRAVQENHVLHPKTPRVPYLLYYRRCDTIGTQTPGR